MSCRICSRQFAGRWGLHRHLAKHGVRAFEYYLADPQARAELLQNLLSETEADGDCRLWRGLTDDGGYGRVRVQGASTDAAHHIACWCVTGEMFDGLYVLHACDRPACIAPVHVSWGTPTANALEREERGRGGARRRIATKLCYEQALEIRQRHANGEGRLVLAPAYGVTPACIDHVVAQRTWVSPDGGRWAP